ncbi:GDSL-type esterase/lipase family protein [Bacillus benzoevorans]|uniref:Lysophospholipase L1-like esterase n=1 Tax=Bacillus benzoevorans TaxID=1456 RepID=A0A7X0HWM1_9BACI|nr:GDSL-type esterase/lipase family protein [Bacillus benzoevorans]MBB6446961.1 lysophospholipase L1-like esterase [Bacillus benzoevorans]
MKKSTIKITTLTAAILSLLWIFGFAWSVQDFYFGKSEDTEKTTVKNNLEKPTGDAVQVIALGDSLTRGTGDVSGKGYVGLVTNQLKKDLRPKEIIVSNLGINGQTSTQLLQQLSQQNIARQLAEADIVLMTIGGNDLFQQGETLFDMNLANVEQLKTQYLTNLQQIFTKIRGYNPNAAVFILGLYNPFIELEDSEATNTVVREWNFATETLTGQFEKIVFVPTFDLFQLSVNDYLYSDHFHPNQEGYKLISDRLAPLISWEEEAVDNE